MADTPSVVPTSHQHEDSQSAVTAPPSSAAGSNARPSVPRAPPVHQIYALPAPIRTFPLPTFYPSNPLSLLHVLYAWASQIISPPPAEPSVIHEGVWSPETRSVHVNDQKSIRALWEQGFFGKGSYSRSEPNWLKREQARRGSLDGHVAEDFTVQRREERKLMKWDRARKEQEAIEKTRREEAWVAPVGPMELLALPNSQSDLRYTVLHGLVNGDVSQDRVLNGHGGVPLSPDGIKSNDTILPVDTTPPSSQRNGHPVQPQTPVANGGTGFSDSSPENNRSSTKRRKSVRFSPRVKSTTYQLSDPPSPHHNTLPNGHVGNDGLPNGTSPLSRTVTGSTLHRPLADEQESESKPETTTEVVDMEHLQLTLEEAFYLVFALGVLTVTDPKTGKAITARDLFTLCRQNSYFPSRKTGLQPDDPFLVHYVVYHHFRSLGWVVRPGIKFGVDWLLYNRGPVFAHAEFAIVVLPAYSDPMWKAEGRRPQPKPWHWLHAINRVQSTALKTLVLVYVDIPPPCDDELDMKMMLKRYRVREFIVKRWLSNRNRD
ncbi:hypothetical protein F4779DRAFT_597437 [Xylariaceae sp. FL0662B]|nr:hypothetical protein F4779DRAFT_597437 [Xylariaceae sp. FL0662B]